MKNNFNVNDVIEQLVNAHKQINEKLFNNFLNEIKILIEKPKRSDSGVLGYITSQSDEFNKEKQIMVIVTSCFNGNPCDVLNVLTHEMIHQYNAKKNTIDSFNNNRHNKNFKKTAEMIGYMYTPTKELNQNTIEYSQRKKWGYANPNDYSEHYKRIILNLNIDYSLLKIKHGDSEVLKIEKQKRKRFYTYICDCFTVIKSEEKKGLNIKCNICNSNFKSV